MPRKPRYTPKSFLNGVSRRKTRRGKLKNEWTQQLVRWLDMDKWKACGKPFSVEELEGRDCFVGLDLSSKIDLTAVVAVFPPEEGSKEWKILPYFFVPEENAPDREKKR